MCLQFETQVVKVEPLVCPGVKTSTGQGQRWAVTTAPVLDKASSVTEEFDAVILCNG